MPDPIISDLKTVADAAGKATANTIRDAGREVRTFGETHWRSLSLGALAGGFLLGVIVALVF